MQVPVINNTPAIPSRIPGYATAALNKLTSLFMKLVFKPIYQAASQVLKCVVTIILLCVGLLLTLANLFSCQLNKPMRPQVPPPPGPPPKGLPSAPPPAKAVAKPIAIAQPSIVAHLVEGKTFDEIFQLCNKFFNDSTRPENVEIARELARQAAERGHYEALLTYGIFTQQENPEEAVEYYDCFLKRSNELTQELLDKISAVARNGHMGAMYVKAQLYAKSQKVDDAQRWYNYMARAFARNPEDMQFLETVMKKHDLTGLRSALLDNSNRLNPEERLRVFEEASRTKDYRKIGEIWNWCERDFDIGLKERCIEILCQGRSPDHLFDMAVHLFNQERQDSLASALFTDLASKDYIGGNFGLGMLAHDRGQYETAIQQYNVIISSWDQRPIAVEITIRSLIASDKQFTGSLYILAKVSEKQNNLLAARAYYKPIIEGTEEGVQQFLAEIKKIPENLLLRGLMPS